jgi:hypothetical protein
MTKDYHLNSSKLLQNRVCSSILSWTKFRPINTVNIWFCHTFQMIYCLHICYDFVHRGDKISIYTCSLFLKFQTSFLIMVYNRFCCFFMVFLLSTNNLTSALTRDECIDHIFNPYYFPSGGFQSKI